MTARAVQPHFSTGVMPCATKLGIATRFRSKVETETLRLLANLIAPEREFAVGEQARESLPVGPRATTRLEYLPPQPCNQQLTTLLWKARPRCA